VTPQQDGIGWFSAGVTSAVAIKLALDSGKTMRIIYFDTGWAHPDNERFIKDCEKWYGQEIITRRSKKYSSVEDVIRKRRFINGPTGALCTAELKKNVRFEIEKEAPYDFQVFGFEYSPREIKRAERFTEQYPDAKPIFPLIEKQVTKANALYMLGEAGIEVPAVYKLGFHNNNCLPCVKSGMGAMNLVRKHFPERFQLMSELEQYVGRSCIKGTFLKDLDPEAGYYPREITPECGIYCPVEDSE
jgi:3'-phosphoadenosine 5'-phosphosulfate sulfotransferase (PAPS reductase)/FAD synthetase